MLQPARLCSSAITRERTRLVTVDALVYTADQLLDLLREYRRHWVSEELLDGAWEA